MSDIAFPEYRYACVSTSHITEQDNLLLGAVAERYENRVATVPHTVHSYIYGYWIYVGNLDPNTVTAEEIENELEGIRDAGYSEAFVALLREVGGAGRTFLRLDADGDVIDGLETFCW